MFTVIVTACCVSRHVQMGMVTSPVSLTRVICNEGNDSFPTRTLPRAPDLFQPHER